MNKYRNRSIIGNASLLSALKKMDKIDKKLLIVLDKNDKFLGLLSIGDIQRAIIKNVSLGDEIHKNLRKNIRIAKPEDSPEQIEAMILEFRMELCPVITSDKEIINVYFWEDLFQKSKPTPSASFDIPVVIMAGGYGSRLRPLTHVLPKPLIPLGEKTMLEHIFQNFAIYGCQSFYISVNYKAPLIKYYINQLGLPYEVSFFEENKPLGTAGSLGLLKGKIQGTFFVSNCDILIDQDYSEVLDYHRSHNNEITIIAALKNYYVPYGTIETGEDGVLLDMKEKPEITFKINSGMYILESHLLEEIPDDQFFHITELIQKVKARGGKVGVFPVSESAWKDIGDWKLYLSENKIA